MLEPRQRIDIDVPPEPLSPMGEGVRPLEHERREVLDNHHTGPGEGVFEAGVIPARHEAGEGLDRRHHLWGRLHEATLSQVKRNGNML